MQLLKSEIIKEDFLIQNHYRIFPLILHSLVNLHQGDDLMKSSSKYFFVKKECLKYLENPFKGITFVYMHI